MIGLGIFFVIGFIASRLLAQYVVEKNPPIGKFIDVNYHGKSISLHYLDSLNSNEENDTSSQNDDRPVLILIHGATGNLHDFKSSIYDSLSENYRVIVFDRPGLGYSERPNFAMSEHWCSPMEQMELIRSAILALGIQKPFILGHSLAGPVVLDYMLEHEKELSGCILLSPVSHPWPNGVTWYNYLDMFPVIKQLLAFTWLPIFGYFNVNSGINILFDPEIAPKNYRKKTALDLFFRSKVMLDNFRDQRLLCEYVAIAGRRYREISVPVQIISGQNDDVVTTWLHSEKLSYELQNVKWLDIPHLGHSPHHSQPQTVVDTIHDFIAHHHD